MSPALSWLLVVVVGVGLLAAAVLISEWVDASISRHRSRFRRSLLDLTEHDRHAALREWGGRAQHPSRRGLYDWKRDGL